MGKDAENSEGYVRSVTYIEDKFTRTTKRVTKKTIPIVKSGSRFDGTFQKWSEYPCDSRLFQSFFGSQFHQTCYRHINCEMPRKHVHWPRITILHQN